MDLWVIANSSLHKYPLNSQVQEVTIGNRTNDSICIQSVEFNESIVLTKESDNEWNILRKDKSFGCIHRNQLSTFEFPEITIQLLLMEMKDDRIFYTGEKKEIVFSDEDGDVNILPVKGLSSRVFTLDKQGEHWHANPKGNRNLYLNGKGILERHRLKIGDMLFNGYSIITIKDTDLLQIQSYTEYRTVLTETALPFSKMKSKYPLYQRTPRLIYESPDDKVMISFPMQESEEDGRGLWIIILPPLVMLLVIGFIAVINPRGIFMLISIMMFTMTIFTSSVQFFRDKKKHKIRSEKRLKVYTRYLEEKREQLDALYKKQQQVAFYHYPSFEEMKEHTTQISNRIWERSISEADFLSIRIGKADVASTYEVNINNNDLANREIDHLIEESQALTSKYRTIKNIPLPVNLSFGSIALIGKHSVVIRELQQIIGQMAFFQSYHDVRFVLIFHKEDYGQFEWLRWLPHFQLPYSFAKGFIYDEKTRDQLLTSMYHLIRERELESENEQIRFSPHFVFIVSDRNLIAEHIIMEYLEGAKPDLGFSTIFVADSKENVTENVHTVVQYINDHEGEIMIEQKKAVHKTFYLDNYITQGNEEFARTLGSLEHQIGLQNSIPESVSFLQLFQVKKPEELQIRKNWRELQSSQSLAVPIGLKGKNDLVYLNLHEKAHGPHGLVAGTTGSGKSEMLQTYILSLAVHYHPHEVSFLLIDYKGGGMAQTFKNIPHLLGTITNIEGSKNFSNRALASIKSELKKRQRIFNDFNVNHIDSYTELYKSGIAEVPLPHLFLICDEFAELKSVEPEFIKELVSAARIGRSLGVHLILATQKPGGVIDHQIWSNARFKISLKVQDESDSREILKNTDAAQITTTGRGYLQVGNNEVYELFQSAWSGAPYITEASEIEDEISIITDLGLIQVSDVRGNKKRKGQKITEIDLVVEHILEIQNEQQIEPVKSPWLPPLPNRLFTSFFVAQQNGDTLFKIGLKDEPEKQSQTDYEYTWLKDGNIIIFGSSGYGKSTTVITHITRFAEAFSPEQMQVYIFDFGSGSLLPLKQLPHTGDYFRIDEQRKIEKFFTFMKSEMNRRKQLFIEKEVSHITIYNSLAEQKLPIIYLVIDNFDIVKEEMVDYENIFTQFSRDGQSLGIYFILTATRVHAVRQPLMNNFKTKIFHYLLDSTEMIGVIGRQPFEPEPIPGRAIIKKEQTSFVQTYLPVDARTDLEMLDKLQELIQHFKKKYLHHKQPSAIPMLPATLSMSDFVRYYPTDRSSAVRIGLCEEAVVPVEISFEKNPHLLVIGQFRKGKTNSLKVILKSLTEETGNFVGLFDNVDRTLSSFAEHEQVDYLMSKEDLNSWLAKAENIIRERAAYYSECMTKNEEMPVFPRVIFAVDSLSRFQQASDNSIQDRLSKLMKEGHYLGFTVIVAGNAPDFTKGYDSFSTELKQVRQALLLMKKTEQNLFTLSYERNEREILPGFGYFIENGSERFIQIPNYMSEGGVKIGQQV